MNRLEKQMRSKSKKKPNKPNRDKDKTVDKHLRNKQAIKRIKDKKDHKSKSNRNQVRRQKNNDK